MKHLLFFFLIGASILFAQDEYHQKLLNQLETEFDVTDGEWVLSDNEKSTNGRLQATNVSRKTLDYSGEHPFSKVLQLTVSSRGENGWDNAVRFPSSKDVKKGDALLAVIWMNSIESDEKYNHVTHKFELTSNPWTQSLILGADIKPGWRQWFLPFEAEVDYDAGQGRYQLDMGHMKGVIKIAGLAVINFGKKYEVDDLPMSTHHMDYDGREPGAAWRTEALQRIENIRKGNLSVKVVNKNGEPVKNAEVDVSLQKHEFGFGTAISARWWLNSGSDSETYLEKLEDLTGDGRSFNAVVFENALKWPTWEGDWLGTPEEVAEIVDWLRSGEYRIRGHNLVWPKWRHLPDDIEQHKNDPDYIRDRIKNRIADVAGYPGIKGYIDEWDVINEMVHCTDLENVFGTKDIYTEWFNWAHDADPNALLYLNEYSIINGGGHDVESRKSYREIIEKLIADGAPLGGIGVQGHMGANFTPPQKVLDILDEFKKYELDISITEYDASGAADDIAADYMRDILIVAFSHPMVKNFLMWGFWDGSHWHSDAPIFNQDWTLKPSGETFIDWVFNKWWTDESGKTSRDGFYRPNAFYGQYTIRAEFDGETAEKQFTFSKDQKNVELKLDTDLTSVSGESATPQTFKLYANAPNPFNPSTDIEYALPENTYVKLTVHNHLGRVVKTLVNRKEAAGHYRVRWSGVNELGEKVTSGVYFYTLAIDGRESMSRKMMLLK